MRHGLSLLAAALIASPLLATDYYVSANRGNDANAGSYPAPFKTISKAISVVGQGDRILVLPGRYSVSAGETFPLTVPAGVDLIGTDWRECVIDGEYDPKSPTNPYDGTLIQLLDQTRFAHVSVVNGSRDPTTPSNKWWKIAILVQGQTGNSTNVTIDHILLDEFSRGIVCGYAVGDHNMTNIKIHDCVLTRFYVEGINSWIQAGSASGNMIYNCTISGHINPTNNIPWPRACMSFGPGAQFDIRNCVIMLGDWAGIEVSTPSTITSDYNCIYKINSGGNYRGTITPGTNDLLVDPQLAAVPTVTALMDPHQTSTTSPLWRKGTNLPGQQTDNEWDYNSPRIQVATVDIGADEWGFHDAYFFDMPKIGTTPRIGMVGTASTAALLILGFHALPTGLTIPGINGQLFVDPALPIVIAVVPKDARGYGMVPLPIPNLVALLDVELVIQGLDTPVFTFSDVDRVRLIR